MSPTVLLVTGVLAVFVAVIIIAYLLLAAPVARIPKGRRSNRPENDEQPLVTKAARAFVGAVDSVLHDRGWAPFRVEELRQAGITVSPSVVVSGLLAGSFGGFLLAWLVGGPALGLLVALAVPVSLKVRLTLGQRRRRRAFEKQLDPILRIVSSALRAGQSLQIAFASVAADAEEPMATELNRIVNENRVGRDIVQAMLETADRMRSEDFRWFAEAVDVQRETGGNLNDIIEVVAETIRDRAEIRNKINAYASEGKASAVVLMGLPVVLAGVYMVMSPGYLDPLLYTLAGQFLLALSAVLYGLAWVWMRAIVNIKV